MLVLNKLSNPFSPGEIYSGFVKTNKSKKDTPFAKKLVKVYMPIDLVSGLFRNPVNLFTIVMVFITPGSYLALLLNRIGWFFTLYNGSPEFTILHISSPNSRHAIFFEPVFYRFDALGLIVLRTEHIKGI